jgi:hypothetical protein
MGPLRLLGTRNPAEPDIGHMLAIKPGTSPALGPRQRKAHSVPKRPSAVFGCR